jgi:hypothetical protein
MPNITTIIIRDTTKLGTFEVTLTATGYTINGPEGFETTKEHLDQLALQACAKAMFRLSADIANGKPINFGAFTEDSPTRVFHVIDDDVPPAN